MSEEMKKLIIDGQEFEVVDAAGRQRITVLENTTPSGGGLSITEKNLILQLFGKAAYSEADAGTAYTTLSNLWSGSYYSVAWEGSGYTKSNSDTVIEDGESFTSTITANAGKTIESVAVTMGGETVQGAYSSGTITIPNVTGDIVITVTTAQMTVSSIAAVYTQSGTVYDTDALDSLKADLVVTATFPDQSTAVIDAADYTLSGTLLVGTSSITVSYGGKTASFNVTVTLDPPYTFYDYMQGDGTAYINTERAASTYCTNSYEQEVKVAGHMNESSKAVCGARQQWGSANARGVWHTNATYSQTYCGKDTGYTMTGSSLDVPVIIKTTTDKKIYFDGTLVDTGTGSVAITHNGPITLFAECTSGKGSGYVAISNTTAYAGAFSKSRIYYFKVKDSNGDLVADLRPAVRKSDSAIGMYDMVRGEFYQNARDTGAFSVGNE